MAESEESKIGEKPSADYEDSQLLLTEDEAFAKARVSPDQALPIFLTYSFHDKDNPRNWPKWRKWYITFFVSMLNVVTYVPSLSLSSDTLPVSCSNLSAAASAPVASHPEPQESLQNSASRPRWLPCVCRCMY